MSDSDISISTILREKLNSIRQSCTRSLSLEDIESYVTAIDAVTAEFQESRVAKIYLLVALFGTARDLLISMRKATVVYHTEADLFNLSVQKYRLIALVNSLAISLTTPLYIEDKPPVLFYVLSPQAREKVGAAEDDDAFPRIPLSPPDHQHSEKSSGHPNSLTFGGSPPFYYSLAELDRVSASLVPAREDPKWDDLFIQCWFVTIGLSSEASFNRGVLRVANRIEQLASVFFAREPLKVAQNLIYWRAYDLGRFWIKDSSFVVKLHSPEEVKMSRSLAIAHSMRDYITQLDDPLKTPPAAHCPLPSRSPSVVQVARPVQPVLSPPGNDQQESVSPAVNVPLPQDITTHWSTGDDRGASPPPTSSTKRATKKRKARQETHKPGSSKRVKRDPKTDDERFSHMIHFIPGSKDYESTVQCLSYALRLHLAAIASQLGIDTEGIMMNSPQGPMQQNPELDSQARGMGKNLRPEEIGPLLTELKLLLCYGGQPIL